MPTFTYYVLFVTKSNTEFVETINAIMNKGSIYIYIYIYYGEK